MKLYPFLVLSLLLLTVPVKLFIGIVIAFVTRQNGAHWPFSQSAKAGLLVGMVAALVLDWQVRRGSYGWLADLFAWLGGGRS